MKKRLLSAALALAMVLTLLPVSAFAAIPPNKNDLKGYGNENVAYVALMDADHPTPGWYVTYVDTTVSPNKTHYIQVTEGFSVGGKYYRAVKEEYTFIFNKNSDGVNTSLKSNTIFIGGTNVTLDFGSITSASLDVFGGVTLGIKGAALTSLTIGTSQYASTGTKGAFTLDTDVTKLTSLQVTNAKTTSNISMESLTTDNKGAGHSITLNNAETGTISLKGVGSDANKTQAAQTVNITSSSTGNITVEGNGSTVTLNGVQSTTAPTVELKGTSTTLNVKGGSVLGDVTFQGATTATNPGAATVAARPANITVDAGCTVGKITHTTAGELCSQANTVTINGTAGDDVTLKNATVNVSSGNTKSITLESGTVNVSGSNGSVGDITLSHDATFNLTGTYYTVGDLKLGTTDKNAATVTFNVPVSTTNKLGKTENSVVDKDYKKHTIKGGSWKGEVSADALDTSLVYQLKTDGNTYPYTYFNADQLNDALLGQNVNAKKNELTVVGQTGGSQKITFKNGTTVWGVLTTLANTYIAKLPTAVNKISTPQWTDGVNNPKGGEPYSTPNNGKAVELNAGGGGGYSGNASKLVNARVISDTENTKDIRAAINGTSIVLTGAVPSGQISFKLELETDAVTVEKDTSGSETQIPVVVTVGVIYNPATKSLVFENTMDTDLGNGVTQNSLTTIKLSNGTVYTLNGSGLVVRSNSIKVAPEDNKVSYPTDESKTYTTTFIEVTVSAPGYTATKELKQQVIDVINGKDAKVDWSGSPAMLQAINAALATISDSQVTGFIQAAQRKAWSDTHRDPYVAGTSKTAYDSNATVWLVPYLQVNVTAYRPSNSDGKNGHMTATLTPMWRVEVHPADGSNGVKVKDVDGQSKNGVYIAKAGTALNIASSDLTGTGKDETGVQITFKSGINGAKYAHQNNTYDYKIDDKDGTFTVTNAVGNTLGSFVFDDVAPLVTLYPDGGKEGDTSKGTPVHFSTLQAAMDASKDDDYILVDSTYSGSTTVNMTGKARTVYVQANGKTVVVANASGGLVDNNGTGGLYTIRLNRDNAVTKPVETGDVTITVGTNTNGRASVSASKAKAGDTITVTVTPNTGYNAGGLTIRTDKNTSVSYTSTGTNTYRFTVPADVNTITVTPSFVKANTGISVNVTSTSYGTATTSAGTNKVAVGTSVSVTTAPGTGYRTMGLYVTSDTGATSTATRTGVNSFVFTVPSATSYVAVTPRFDVNNGTVFADVWSTEYYSSPVAWAVGRGITDGTSTYTFSPGQSCTRAQMVTFLWRAAGRPSTAGMSNPFYDVSPTMGSDFYNAILWAYANKITDGTSAHYFSPNATVTRAQAVTFLWRYAGKPAAASYSGFYDVPTSEYYAQAVTWAVNKGITNGDGSTVRFNPNGACLRAQIVTFLYRQATGARA